MKDKEKFRKRMTKILVVMTVLLGILPLLTELNKDSDNYKIYLFFTLLTIFFVLLVLIYIFLYENKYSECHIKGIPEKFSLHFKNKKKINEEVYNNLLCEGFEQIKVKDDKLNNKINIYVKEKYFMYEIYLVIEMSEFDISKIIETVNLVYCELKKRSKINHDYILTNIIMVDKATKNYDDFFSNCIEQKKGRYYLPVGIDINSKQLITPVQKEKMYVKQYNSMKISIKNLFKKLIE